MNKDAGSLSRARRRVVIFVFILILLLVLLAWWLLWRSPGSRLPDESPGRPSGSIAGPCFDGAANTLPEGFVFYESPTLGYRFAYPDSWGTVSVTTTPIASESGNYVMGRFSANANIWFGGNATDYVVRPRDGIPTDLPGYLKASGKYYTVELWRFNDGTSIIERDDLHPIAMPYEERTSCNTSALVTRWEANELSSIGPADVAHFNLKPTNAYYGVNFVLDKPSDATRHQFEKLIASFELY